MNNRQMPLQSGFEHGTTASEVIAGLDLAGMTAIVTGGYSGLGLETVRVLAEAGAQVVVPTRDFAKAEVATQGIQNIELGRLDLMDPASIDMFAADFIASGKPLHMLINGAGVMASPLQRDARGYESQFSTNHLGHFHLTVAVWPALRRAGVARVVSVSSRGHAIAPVDLEDPNFDGHPYDKWRAYGQSKSANALFALELDKRGKRDGIRAFSLHPGAIFTPLQRHMDMDDYRFVGALNEEGRLKTTSEAGFKTVEQGAATAVWCATSPQLAGMGGVYCEDCDIAPLMAPDKSGPGVMSWAVDDTVAQVLWSTSERLTGVMMDQ